MKLVYIIGPFRAKNSWEKEKNVHSALQAAHQVASLGCMPIIPHSMTKAFDGTFSDQFWLDGTLELMRRCDCVFVSEPDRIENSEGSKQEIREARNLKIPIVYGGHGLQFWLTGNKNENKN